MPPVSSVGGAGASAVYGGGATPRAAKSTELTDDQKRQVEQLAKRDREVRQHEQAHLSAAGGYALSGPSYTYTRGPDGKQYATGGEVQIDVSPGRTPQETISKAEVVQRAALAPAQPSAQDRAVAAAAAAQEIRARQELAKQQSDRQLGSPETSAARPVSPAQKAYQGFSNIQQTVPALNVTA